MSKTRERLQEVVRSLAKTSTHVLPNEVFHNLNSLAVVCSDILDRLDVIERFLGEHHAEWAEFAGRYALIPSTVADDD
jgi:hypothetical protein